MGRNRRQARPDAIRADGSLGENYPRVKPGPDEPTNLPHE